MNKEKCAIYSKVLAMVLDDFGVEEQALFSRNEQDCVQARKALVIALSRRGLSDKDIAELTQKMRRCSVCAIRNRYREESAEWTVRHCLEKILESC